MIGSTLMIVKTSSSAYSPYFLKMCVCVRACVCCMVCTVLTYINNFNKHRDVLTNVFNEMPS